MSDICHIVCCAAPMIEQDGGHDPSMWVCYSEVRLLAWHVLSAAASLTSSRTSLVDFEDVRT